MSHHFLDAYAAAAQPDPTEILLCPFASAAGGYELSELVLRPPDLGAVVSVGEAGRDESHDGGKWVATGFGSHGLWSSTLCTCLHAARRWCPPII